MPLLRSIFRFVTGKKSLKYIVGNSGNGVPLDLIVTGLDGKKYVTGETETSLHGETNVLLYPLNAESEIKKVSLKNLDDYLVTGHS